MTPATRRLFVAVTPPPGAVDHFADAVAQLAVSRANQPGRSTRLAPRERWHLTLAFLGEVPIERVDAAIEAVQRGAVDRASGAATAQRAPPVREPIQLRLAGGGTFGRGRFAILWAGLAGDLPALRELATAVRRQVRHARLPMDEKPFRPHLTIARPGDRVSAGDLRADVTALNAYSGPTWPVASVELMESELGPQPRHTCVASFALT